MNSCKIVSLLKLRNPLKIGSHLITRKKHVDLSGIYPPVATPFNSDESIAYDKLASNLSKWNKLPLRGYLIEGTNGEFISLTFEERIEMIKQARKLIPAEKLLLAGSGCESTKMTIELTKHVADAGADAAVVITPFFFKMRYTLSALVNHYSKVADASPIPVILYSVPAATGLDLPVEAIVQLSKHPNIIGIKDSGGDITKIGAIIAQVSPSFQVLAGSASFLLTTYMLGGVGGICSLANVLGEPLCRLHSLFAGNNLKDAKTLQLQLIQPNLAVTKMFGVAGLKVAMELKGLYGGVPRLPLLPLSQTDKETLIRIFRASGFLDDYRR